jgi:molybdopterin molybdotransferase
VAPLTSVDEALRLVLSRVTPLAVEEVPIADAAGRILAEDVRAAVDLPRFPSSAMDGFALRSAETPGELPVVERIAAGRPASRALQPDEAMGIATGGVVPDGADAVVPLEDVVSIEDAVRVPRIEPGANVRPVGGDIARGALVGRAGAPVGAARLAALAAAGTPVVRCRRRPTVAIVSTGTELREPGEQLAPGEIYESNGAMLAALLTSAGAVVRRIRAVADDEDAHRVALAEALACDVAVTSGGVSVGPHDLVRPTLAALGVEEVFWGVAMRPGKPLAFGVRDATLVFGLPGNPVSSFVSATLFVVPALLALQGATEPGPRYLRGLLDADATPRPGRDDFVRAALSAEGRLTPHGRQESHMIVAAADADALVRLPAGPAPLPAGTEVAYLRLDTRPAGA